MEKQESQKDQPEFLKPLDFSKWDEKLRQTIEQLRDLMTNRDPTRIQEHRDILPTIPNGLGDAEHLGNPAHFALLAYGRDGLAALYETAIGDQFEAGFWSGKVLASAAVQDEEAAENGVFLSQRYLSRDAYENLRSAVLATIRDNQLASEAKRYVSKMLTHYAADSSRRPQLSTVLSGLSTNGEGLPESRLIWDLMGSATLQISDELCNEAEDLIQKDLDEAAYQAFFEQHPALLDPLAATTVPRQVLAEMWKTDFVIRRFDDQYVFVELEKPKDSLFTGYPQPSASLSHALGQVLSWFAWVEDNIAYAQTHGFPNIHLPRGLIVMGRGGSLNADQRRMLRLINDLLNHRILVWTYDEVIQNARNVVRNLTSR